MNELDQYNKPKKLFSLGRQKGCSVSSESSLPPFETRDDRIGTYLKKYMKKFVFDEFSKAYIDSVPGLEFMKRVPIPLRKEDLEEFKGGAGLKLPVLSENMAWVMGIDPGFKYVPQYVQFMNHFFRQKLLDGLVKEGRDEAERGELDPATIHFRAALILNSSEMNAMYSYARVCREQYLKGEDETFIAKYKAESAEFFEMLTIAHPKFSQAYYYLGYAYLNLGLYQKANLTWQEYVKLSRHPKDRKEILERLKQLKQPLEIEKGTNEVLAGRWQEGLDMLEPFLDTNFKNWWPLSYYLGVAYARTGRNSQAVTSFKRTLGMNGSHIESMKELADLYALSNDKENEKKYRQKIELVLEPQEETEKKADKKK